MEESNENALIAKDEGEKNAEDRNEDDEEDEDYTLSPARRGSSFASKYLPNPASENKVHDDDDNSSVRGRGRRSTKLQLRGYRTRSTSRQRSIESNSVPNEQQSAVTTSTAPSEPTCQTTKRNSPSGSSRVTNSRRRSQIDSSSSHGIKGRRQSIESSANPKKENVQEKDDTTAPAIQENLENDEATSPSPQEEEAHSEPQPELPSIDFEEFSVRGSRSIQADDNEDDADDDPVNPSESYPITTETPASLLQQSTDEENDDSEEEDILDDLIVNSLHGNVGATTAPPPEEASPKSKNKEKEKEKKKKSSSKKKEKSSKKNEKKSRKSGDKHRSKDKESENKKKQPKKHLGDEDYIAPSDDLAIDSAEFKMREEPSQACHGCLYENIERISVQILIHKGEDLMAKDRTLFGKLRSSDPYIEVWRNLPTTEVGKTQIKYKTLNPQYEERFKVVWTYKDLQRSISRDQRARIVLKIWDYDKLSGADNMGECSIPIPLPNESDTVRNQWYDVLKESARHARGRIQVSFRVKYENRYYWSALLFQQTLQWSVWNFQFLNKLAHVTVVAM